MNQATSIEAAPGIHDTFDNYNAVKDNSWPGTRTVEGMNNSEGAYLPEGVTSTFTVTTSSVLDGEFLYYVVVPVSGSFSAADLSPNALSGSFEISSNSGTFNLQAIPDGIAEGDVVKVQIKQNSISGDILFETGNLTVTDAALPTGVDITTSFYEIGNRYINSQTYMGSTGDYNGPYDVGEVQTDFTGTGRVYIGVKVTATTTYFNDIPIAGIQVLSGGSLLASWIFNTSAGGSGSGWTTYTSQIFGSSTYGFPVTPATAAGYTYSTLTTSPNVTRFSWASTTGSSYTGAADGISSVYKLTAHGGSNTLATVGDAQISQQGNSYYAYRETSGSTIYSGTVMRSPTYSFSGGEYIRVIHAITGPTSSGPNPDDTLFVAVY